jgi:regulator of RNase E activity RraA/CMP-N-acetylneuraminic acid synthetase
MKVVAFVPAKGESSRVAKKNLRILDGEYLYKRKLRQLLATPLVDAVYLDTDSEEIIGLADDLPVHAIRRPADLASNATDGHALFAFECAYVDADIYIQALCTSPFITAETITRALEALLASEHDSLVAVTRAKLYEWDNGRPAYGQGRIPNSIDLPERVIEQMGLYIVRKSKEGPITRRFGSNPLLFDLDALEAVDINYEEDLRLGERLAMGKREEDNRLFRTIRSHLSSALLSDVGQDLGLQITLPPAFRPNIHQKIIGRAKPLWLRACKKEDDWKSIYDALDSYDFIRSGDIIVVASEVPGRAYFGDLNANLAIRAGAVGAVIDGFTRDSRETRGLDFPVYAHGNYCLDIKYEGILGHINKPITIGNVLVHAGDIIYADEDGVICIPATRWNEVLTLAMAALKKEAAIRIAIDQGMDARSIVLNNGAF